MGGGLSRHQGMELVLGPGLASSRERCRDALASSGAVACELYALTVSREPNLACVPDSGFAHLRHAANGLDCICHPEAAAEGASWTGHTSRTILLLGAASRTQQRKRETQKREREMP